MKVLENRCRNESLFSIKDINFHLDELAKAFDNKKKQEVFKTLVNGCSMTEQKWLVRIILKDLKIGIGHQSILRNYHKEAVDLFNSTSDLHEVFAQL
jgi:DNA ligase 4